MNANTLRTLSVSMVLSFAACAPVDDGADEAVAHSHDAILTTGVALQPGPGITLPTPIAIGTPTLSGFTPSSGRIGDRIVLQGASLDRARSGRFVIGTLGYAVTFAGTNGTRVSAATLTLRSATELEVVVPVQAVTGSVQLIDNLGALSTSPTSFTVVQPMPPPAPTVLRMRNTSQYDLGVVAINGVTVVTCASPIAPGASRDFNVMPGLVTASAVVGWCVNGQAESLPPQALVGQVSVAAGSVGTLTVNPVTLGELATNWGANTAQFSTGLFVGGDGNFHENSFYIDSAARWRAVQDGTQWASGTATVVSWPARAACVSFRFAPNAAVTNFCLPFSGFVFDNRAHSRI
jgi:hypothetical protein